MQDPTTPLLPLFDKAHADVILRSSDGKDFPMYKLDLSRSSQVFKGMLSALEDQRSDLPPFPKSGLPIIPLAEPADVLEVLLRFCLPRSTPAFTDYAMTARVLEGAQKYEIARAASAACAELERMAEDNPVNIYALACHYNLESLARKAALACLRLPLTTLMVSSVEEMESITAVEFRRLLEYRVSCRSAVAQYLQIAARVPSHQSGQYNLWQCTCRWQRASSGTGGNFQQPWWEICFLELTQKLSECTWEGMVEKDALMQAFLDSESCSRCSKAAASQIDHFTTVTASGVADEIARVNLEFEPGSRLRSPPSVLSGKAKVPGPAPRTLLMLVMFFFIMLNFLSLSVMLYVNFLHGGFRSGRCGFLKPVLQSLALSGAICL